MKRKLQLTQIFFAHYSFTISQDHRFTQMVALIKLG